MLLLLLLLRRGMLLEGLLLLGRMLDAVDRLDVTKQLVGHLHTHSAEVWHKMSAIRMAGNVALRALPRILAAKRQDEAAVAAPVGANVRDGLEAVRDSVVDLDLVTICLGIALADALCDDLLSALLVTGVTTVLALAARSIE